MIYLVTNIEIIYESDNKLDDQYAIGISLSFTYSHHDTTFPGGFTKEFLQPALCRLFDKIYLIDFLSNILDSRSELYLNRIFPLIFFSNFDVIRVYGTLS